MQDIGAYKENAHNINFKGFSIICMLYPRDIDRWGWKNELEDT